MSLKGNIQNSLMVSPKINCTSRIVLIFAILFISANAQDKDTYIIGPTDRLAISFWQQPDLNTTVRVSDNGNITLPVIGEIRAAGLTTAELSKKIVEQMVFYNSPVSQATIAVTEYNSRTVVVTGQVLTPGSHSYEKIPDIWKVILDSGGPTSQANLSGVTIVRKDGEKTDVIDVDLYKIIKDGDLSKAPPLKPGDLVNIPVSPYGSAVELAGTPQAERKNIYFVFGRVTTPGARDLQEGIDIMDAITLAGGPLADADLRNIRVIMKDAGPSNIVKIDLENYIDKGTPSRFLLRAEDTVVIPLRRDGTFTNITNRLATVVPIITAIGTLILLYYNIQEINRRR